MKRAKHWRFEKDYTKLSVSKLQILALRAFPSSPRQLAIRAEITQRKAAEDARVLDSALWRELNTEGGAS